MTEPASWTEFEAEEIANFLGEAIVDTSKYVKAAAADAIQEWEDRAVRAERENTLLRQRLHELEPSNGLLVDEAA